MVHQSIAFLFGLLFLVISFLQVNPINIDQFLSCDQFHILHENSKLYYNTLKNYRYQKQPWTNVKISNTEASDALLSSKLFLERISHGSGMHHKVSTKLSFMNLSQFVFSNCYVMFSEYVSPSMYIDIYEVERMSQYFLYYNSSIDIEKPAYESYDHTVLLFRPLLHNGTHYEVSYDINWHIRYHYPSNKNYIKIQLPEPNIYLHCDSSVSSKVQLIKENVLAPCPTQNAKLICSWTKLLINDKNYSLTFSWPVGLDYHSDFVFLVTIFITSISTTFLAYSMIKSKMCA